MAGRAQLRLVSELTELAAGVNVSKDDIPHNFLYPGYEDHELAEIQAALITPRPTATGDASNGYKRRASLAMRRGSMDLSLVPNSFGDTTLHDTDTDLNVSGTPSSIPHPSGLYRRASSVISLDDLPVDPHADDDLLSISDEDDDRFQGHRRGPRLFEVGGKGEALIALGKQTPLVQGRHSSTHTKHGISGKADDLEAKLLAILQPTQKDVAHRNPGVRKSNEHSSSIEAKEQDLDLEDFPDDAHSEFSASSQPSRGKKATPAVEDDYEAYGEEDDEEDTERLAEAAFPTFPTAVTTPPQRSRPAGAVLSPNYRDNPTQVDYPVLASGRRRHRYDHYDDQLNEFIISAPRQPQPQAQPYLDPRTHSTSAFSARSNSSTSTPAIRRPATGSAALAYVLPSKATNAPARSRPPSASHPEIKPNMSQASGSPSIVSTTSPESDSERTSTEAALEQRALSRSVRELMRAIAAAKAKHSVEYGAYLTRALATATPTLGALHPLSVRIAAVLVGWLCAHASADFFAKQFSRATDRLDQALSVTSLVSPPTLKRVLDALDAATPQVLQMAEVSTTASLANALWAEVHQAGVAPLVELILSPALPVLVASRLATLGLAVTITRAGGAIRRTLIVLRERLALHSLLARAEKHPLILAIALANTQVAAATAVRTQSPPEAMQTQRFLRSKVLSSHRSRMLQLLSISGTVKPSLSSQPPAVERRNSFSAMGQADDIVDAKYDSEKASYEDLSAALPGSWADARIWRQVIGESDTTSQSQQPEPSVDTNEDRSVSLSREARRETQLKLAGDTLESTFAIASWLQRATAISSCLAAARFCDGPLLDTLISGEIGLQVDGKVVASKERRKILREAREAAGAGCGAASTHLNLCAVYSELGSHDKALNHAEAATSLIQQELLNIELPNESQPASESSQGSATSDAEQSMRRLVRDKLTLLCVSHHNAAVELEHLRDYQGSFGAYSRAAEIARDTLGASDGDTTPGSKLAKQLEEAADTAAKQVASLMKKQEEERERRLARAGRLGAARSSAALLRQNASSMRLTPSSSASSFASYASNAGRPASASRTGRATPLGYSNPSTLKTLQRASTQRR